MSKAAVLIGIVVVAAVAAGMVFLYWFRGAEVSAVVGPEGGVLEVTDFRSPLRGLTLNIPAGALQENATISLKELPKSKVNSILSARKFASAGKHVLGGFIAEPDGLVFNVPVNVSVPVEPLSTSGGIPVQARVLLDEEVYWLEPTDLVYDPGKAMVDMRIQDFSGHAVVEVEELLKQDPEDEIPCEQLRIHVVSSMEDFSKGTGCQIVGDTVEVTFLDCDPPVTVPASIYETTQGCGPEFNLTVTVDPPSTLLFPCTTVTLEARVWHQNGSEVNVPIWWFNTEEPDKGAALVDQSGVVKGLRDGETLILAVSPDPRYYGECRITVMGYVCSVEVTPSPATVFVGDTLPLTANAKDVDGNTPPRDRFGNNVEGLTTTWSSSDSGIAAVDSSGCVIGVSPGTVRITATVEGVEGYATITVKEEEEPPGEEPPEEEPPEEETSLFLVEWSATVDEVLYRTYCGFDGLPDEESGWRTSYCNFSEAVRFSLSFGGNAVLEAHWQTSEAEKSISYWTISDFEAYGYYEMEGTRIATSITGPPGWPIPPGIPGTGETYEASILQVSEITDGGKETIREAALEPFVIRTDCCTDGLQDAPYLDEFFLAEVTEWTTPPEGTGRSKIECVRSTTETWYSGTVQHGQGIRTFPPMSAPEGWGDWGAPRVVPFDEATQTFFFESDQLLPAKAPFDGELLTLNAHWRVEVTPEISTNSPKVQEIIATGFPDANSLKTGTHGHLLFLLFLLLLQARPILRRLGSNPNRLLHLISRSQRRGSYGFFFSSWITMLPPCSSPSGMNPASW